MMSYKSSEYKCFYTNYISPLDMIRGSFVLIYFVFWQFRWELILRWVHFIDGAHSEICFP